MEGPPKPVSPLTQVLKSMGMTREDLTRHSNQMRQFLTTEDAGSLRVLGQDIESKQSESQSRPLSQRSRSSSSAFTRPKSVSSIRVPSPPPSPTPIKSEPTDPSVTLRHFDSMEAVIERKSRQLKRDKKGRRDREKTAHSPTPSVSLDTFMQSRSRDVRRVNAQDTSRDEKTQENEMNHDPPVTPRPHKYYRNDYNEGSASRSRDAFSPGLGSPTPTRYRSAAISVNPITPVANPVTPRNRKNHYKSPLPSSSPIVQSSPPSSPSRPVVNIVSSPGPMGPLPDEDDDDLPYTLPPGPYSPAKPDLPYAALIGRAILSSPDHRLTLQEIYDWITIVFPYFKRGETTWMNSIRHVLSTTICFRKVPRDRSVGRTLWAIWDCDIECFRDGGFRKQFCADMMEQAAKNKLKRPATRDSGGTPRKAKRQKKASVSNPSAESFPVLPLTRSLPIFPLMHSSIHHQPYHESCIPQPFPAEIVFPPLHTTQQLAAVLPASTTTTSSTTGSTSESSTSPSFQRAAPEDLVSPTSPLPSSSSLPSLPSLTLGGSSSSPTLPFEDPAPEFSVAPDTITVVTPKNDRREKSVFSDINSADILASEILLLDEEEHEPLPRKKLDKGKRKQTYDGRILPKRSMALPPMPDSPTLDRKAANRIPKPAKPPTTPPAIPLCSITSTRAPVTPPRNSTNTINLSPTRTPLSHKGLHMSPSPSLAHYKSNLDPPPIASFDAEPPEADVTRTPSRKRVSSNVFGPPVTPKKFSLSAIGDSPFRPAIFDPHDPGTLLDEELSRMGASQSAQDSPAGLYGRSRAMLYESPNAGSPGRWTRWW